MANQPSKYSKFLVGAASAALVASAVAPVASAADFKDTKGNTHEEAINALSDSGVIKGYSDGTFLPNKTLTRSDVVKMMGKWLVTEGHAIPADARTNPRFTDLSTKSNAELLDYAAVVKDAGVFIGSNGKLLAVDNITRENMALVLVRAFDTVEKIDLATYVAGQDFKRDVKDLTSAKSEARAAIDVLDFFDITNPTVASFNPKGNTTRGHFATFLHKTINADFSKVAGEAAEGVVSVKAVNATTVEVAFKEDVKDVKTSDYTIEGLAISNAAVKQTDSKVVVLTTAAQSGDKEYTLKSGESTLGKFKGISAVIPTKITMNTVSTQGVVGKEVTLKADIGVKEAGVAVTFNVTAGSKLNKDHIEEVLTNAEGIATYSYTQYVSGEKDEVVAYPTGAPAVRSLATVYWGVTDILTVTADDKKGEKLTNGENKIYKATYLDPKTGKPVANTTLNVTFAENVDTTIDKTTNATINGKTPMQLTNGKVDFVTVTTNAKGEATFTVSGTNAKATPVVFVDASDDSKAKVNNTLEASELQVKAAELTFGATQSDYTIEVTRDGKEEAAVGVKNGREYNIVIKQKDGKVAANEWVQVAFNEDIDRLINTNTKAYFIDADGNEVPDARTKSYSVKTNSKGEASFTIGSDDGNIKDYATPVVWMDINSSNAKEGKLDDGEPFKLADMTYFAEPKLTSGVVKAYNGTVEVKEDKEFKGTETATFRYDAANQSGKVMTGLSGYAHLDVSFTVFNTGDNDIMVGDKLVSPNRNITVSKTGAAPAIEVKSVNDKTTSVRVEATGTAVAPNYTNSNTNNLQSIYLGNVTAKASFKSTKDVGNESNGIVTKFDTDKKEITFAGKNKVSYKGKNATFFNEDVTPTQTLTEQEFATLVSDPTQAVEVRLFITGDNYKFIIKDTNPKSTTKVTATTAQAIDANGDGNVDSVELTFSKAVSVNQLSATDFTFAGGSVTATKIESVTGNTSKVKITVSGATGLSVPNLSFSEVLFLGADYADLASGSISVSNAAVTALATATAAVEAAETAQTQASVNAAQTLVLNLPLGADRTALQNRLDVVQALINAGNTDAAVQAANVAVAAAESSKTQGTVDTAQGKVDLLPAGTIQISLQSRIDAVQAIVDVATAKTTITALNLAWNTDVATTVTTANAAITGATLPVGVTATAAAGTDANAGKVVVTISKGAAVDSTIVISTP